MNFKLIQKTFLISFSKRKIFDISVARYKIFDTSKVAK